MLETVVNALKVKEIRSKIIFTLLILLLVRFGSYIPVPGVNPEILSKVFSNKKYFMSFAMRAPAIVSPALPHSSTPLYLKGISSPILKLIIGCSSILFM